LLNGNFEDRNQNERPLKLVRIMGRLTGGPARQACLLHEQLEPAFDTRLIMGSLSAGEHDMSDLLSSQHNVLRLGAMSREISWSDVRAFWKIFTYLRRERPDVVHTHTAKAGALGRLAAWLAGVPVIVHTFHGHVFYGYFGQAKTRVYLAIERALGRLTSRVIAISESQREELSIKYRVVSREKISVVQNGFELASFSRKEREIARQKLGLRPDQFVLAWAGRMAPVKDVPLLGEVIRRAAESLPQACFLVVGDGEQRAEFEAQIQGCDNVKLLGWRRDMETIWSAADAAILTSRNEGTPTALIEAMAAGLPFVATDVGAVADLAVGKLQELPHGMGRRGSNGFLTARTPEALYYSVEQLIENPQIAKQMGAAGREFVMKRFASDRLVKELTALYQDLLEKCGEYPAGAARTDALPETELNTSAATAGFENYLLYPEFLEKGGEYPAGTARAGALDALPEEELKPSVAAVGSER
jgi:glycosyltransferase involved in cell wall biosynthesis